MHGRIIAPRCRSALCRVGRPRLPTAAEWERAARGGLDGAAYTGGESYDPIEGLKANSWQGRFPQRDEGLDGHHGTAPVGCFEGNGYGPPDMAGTIWEWTADWYAPGHPATPATEPAGAGMMDAAAAAPDDLLRRVITGGSWLCAPNFCARYRPRRAPADGRRPRRLAHWLSHRGRRAATRRVMRSASD